MCHRLSCSQGRIVRRQVQKGAPNVRYRAHSLSCQPPCVCLPLQLRVVVPGFVGTRSVKWLRRITLSESESKSAWQQKDYKLMPQRCTTLSAADWQSMPPIMVSVWPGQGTAAVECFCFCAVQQYSCLAVSATAVVQAAGARPCHRGLRIKTQCLLLLCLHRRT